MAVISPFERRVRRVPAHVQQCLAGGLEPLGAPAAERFEDVLAVQVALRFDLVPVQELLDHLDSRGPARAGPVQEPGPRPQPGDIAVLRGHVRGVGGVLALPAGLADMLGDDLLPVEDRHPTAGQPQPQQPSGQPVGNRVMLIAGRNVIIALRFHLLPFDLLEDLAGQRGQRRGFFLAEQLEPGRAVGPADLMVDLEDPLIDGVVQLGQRRPRLLGQIADHPLVDDVDTRLDRRLVAWLAHPGWHDRDPVVVGHLPVTVGDEPGSVAPGLAVRRGGRIVGDQDLHGPADELERGNVRGDPRFHPHVSERTAEHVARERQHCQEQVRPGHLTGHGIDQRDRVAGPAGQHRPAGLVMQHRDQVVADRRTRRTGGSTAHTRTGAAACSPPRRHARPAAA